jgi:hypothetical protein
MEYGLGCYLQQINLNHRGQVFQWRQKRRKLIGPVGRSTLFRRQFGWWIQQQSGIHSSDYSTGIAHSLETLALTKGSYAVASLPSNCELLHLGWSVQSWPQELAMTDVDLD